VRDALPWDAARAALDLLLERGTPPLLLEFSGGEPLLEPDLLARYLEYAESPRPGVAEVRTILTTNGTLLSPSIQDFLEAHGVLLRLSCDGPPPSQQLRGRGTFQRLAGRLDELESNHPGYLQRSVRIQAVSTPGTLPHLAAGARFFLNRGIADIAFQPVIGRNGDWNDAAFSVLEEQVGEIVAEAARHWAARRAVPVAFLRGPGPEAGHGPGGGFICGAGVGKGLCVDPDGRGWTYPLFASSLQDLSPLARQVSAAVDLGDVRSGGLWKRLSTTRQRTGPLTVMTNRHGRYSPYGACRDRACIDECSLCPAAVAHAPDNGDPDRVPAFICAFKRVTTTARRRFRALATKTVR
jgi:MoaA/NifB/PqqE/SkfB family radical SAM enzyme